MQQITININPSIYEHIMFFLQNLPKDLVDIQTQNIKQRPSKVSTSSKAFGILNGKIKDPVAWQRAIREESDRDIYKNRFSEFVGIWKDRDITQESIRKEAWR